jgi:hypothetical protein
MYTPTKGRRELVLYGKKAPDTVVKVNGVVQEHEDGVIYRFETSNDFHGWFDISIEGLVEIDIHKCFATYPIYRNGDSVLTPCTFKQYKFCLWMYPQNYGYHDGIEYKHLMLNGATYLVKDRDKIHSVYEYDTDLDVREFDYAYNMQYILKDLHDEVE